MSLFLGPDNSTRPVQWKTREPIRPKLHDDGGGFLLPRLVQARRKTDWPSADDVVAGIVGAVIVAVLWGLAAAFGG